jgi:hypothetical protein
VGTGTDGGTGGQDVIDQKDAMSREGISDPQSSGSRPSPPSPQALRPETSERVDGECGPRQRQPGALSNPPGQLQSWAEPSLEADPRVRRHRDHHRAAHMDPGGHDDRGELVPERAQQFWVATDLGPEQKAAGDGVVHDRAPDGIGGSRLQNTESTAPPGRSQQVGLGRPGQTAARAHGWLESPKAGPAPEAGTEMGAASEG